MHAVYVCIQVYVFNVLHEYHIGEVASMGSATEKRLVQCSQSKLSLPSARSSAQILFLEQNSPF